MNLADLLRGYRRSEPTTLLVLKLLIMIILGGLSRCFLLFSCGFNFTMAICLEEYDKIDSGSTLMNCMPDITHSDEKYGPSHRYFAIYQPSHNLFFYNSSDINDYTLLGITLGFFINDSNYTSDQSTQAMFGMSAFDSDDEPLINYMKEKNFNDLKQLFNDTAVDSTSNIDSVNNYVLVPNQFFQLEYVRKIKEFIQPSWMNDFGIPPTYKNSSYIETTLLSSSLPMSGSSDGQR
ncbi:hypothetical protein RclHR1_05970009 [Rhizophagus clarus]|uniref:Uncharacterized protein n=1 Tax=Rhizophagus clarus TaxID=94130 RepID=A0A2Z6S856_9GLOM|nr:hypothetical protein RclHR1_05970009 [Rhizophagus clarus]GES78858.1 hypothetical protein GLOIN_2v1768947 [Rhizophagus clarus]